MIVVMLLPWQQTSKGSGRVIAYSPNDRPQEITAPVEGRVKKWHVVEGQYVKEGDLIVDLEDIDPQISERLESERDAAFRKLQATEVSAATTRINLAREKQLVEQGISSRRDYEQARLEYAKFLSESATAAKELARIEVKLSRQLSQRVIATRNGYVQAILAGQGGQIVKSGTAIATLVPDTKSRVVELFIDGNDVPLIRRKQTVRLQFEGWPAVQFAGQSELAVGTFVGEVRFVDQFANATGQFRVLIGPPSEQAWPSADQLRQGVRTIGWIQINQVPLGYELWRRINAFPIIPPSQTQNKEQTKEEAQSNPLL
ncbi:MAG: HlyD family efflux transporter periplasmic adaptor subunit [bacterium]|nr:HlyD family efflux transporter periplasmic adaptor subunit [bacterium]